MYKVVIYYTIYDMSEIVKKKYYSRREITEIYGWPRDRIEKEMRKGNFPKYLLKAMLCKNSKRYWLKEEIDNFFRKLEENTQIYLDRNYF
jgi:hypothetical protein